jgi:hypothetical protein
MRTIQPTLMIDLGTASAAAAVVTDRGSWLVPDPATGDSRWSLRVRASEHVADLLSGIRTQALRSHAPLDRAVITIRPACPAMTLAAPNSRRGAAASVPSASR